MKRTSSTKKFSLGIKIASILTCVVLTAVGFASWLIVAPTSATTTGSFEVYEVEENHITIDTDVINSTVVFGKSDSTKTNPWLVAGTDVEAENLQASFTVTVNSDKVTVAEAAAYIAVEFKVTNILTAFNTALTDKYLATPEVTVKDAAETGTVSENSSTYNTDDGTITVYIPTANITSTTDDNGNHIVLTVTIDFGWGEAFKAADANSASNPYDYFNGLSYTTDNANAAKTALEAIAALDDDSTEFSLTISTTNTNPNAAND